MIRRTPDRFHFWAMLLSTVAIVITLIFLGLGWSHCASSGGKYVRGMIWMECIR